MSYKTKYHIEVSEFKTDQITEPSVYTIELETNDLEWSMEQYQRNRQPLTYKVIASIDEWTSKDYGRKTDDSSSV